MDWSPILIICATIYLTTSLPQGGSPNPANIIKIITDERDINPDGSYQWRYETENGIKAQENGNLKKTNDPENPETIVAEGSYSYTDPEGNQISLTYVADDEGGFQPQGAHLPTPPPIPPNIQRALDFIASQPSTTERVGKRK